MGGAINARGGGRGSMRGVYFSGIACHIGLRMSSHHFLFGNAPSLYQAVTVEGLCIRLHG